MPTRIATAPGRPAGAVIVNPPTDYPFGERQHTAEDLGGHRWTFDLPVKAPG